MTVPNALTLLRILLVPVFWIFEASGTPGGSWAALLIFIFASLTDLFDGKIARRTGQVTTFGKIMDPLADKLLVTAALLVFLDAGRTSAVSVMCIIGRELAVTSLRVVAISSGKLIAASSSGKWKTTCQMVYIILMLLHIGQFSFIPCPLLIEEIVQWVTVAVTLWSGIMYFYQNRDIIHLKAN